MKRGLRNLWTLWALTPLALLPLAAGCGGGETAGETAPAPAAPAEKTALVRTLLPERQDVTDLAVLSADLAPAHRGVLAAEVPGVVERMPVDVGDRVARGTLIAAIDTRTLEQRVAEAEALAHQADVQAQRAEALIEKHSITQSQYVDAVTGREVAAARLASARLDLGKSQLRAPWAGEIAAKRAEVGDYVVPGQPVVELVDSATLTVRAMAPAADVPHLRVGAPVTIHVDALPGETFGGRVVRLGAELDPKTRSLAVEAELPNGDRRLKPGLLARMEVPRRQLEGALLVPLEALIDLGEQRALFVVSGGRAERRIVTLGPVIGERVVIASGLAPGERVIVEGEQRVADGQPVEEAAAAAPAAGAAQEAR